LWQRIAIGMPPRLQGGARAAARRVSFSSDVQDQEESSAPDFKRTRGGARAAARALSASGNVASSSGDASTDIRADSQLAQAQVAYKDYVTDSFMRSRNSGKEIQTLSMLSTQASASGVSDY